MADTPGSLTRTERLLRACRGEPVDRPPAWRISQAGRYLPEYRRVREGIPFLAMCRDVERAVEVSLQPLERVGTEAVIFFSDIFVPVSGLGIDVEFSPGPTLAEPLRTREQVDKLPRRDPREAVPYVFEILRRLRRELEPRAVPLLGFAGAPFTLAAYLVRGRGDPERRFPELRQLMEREPAVLRALMERLAKMTVDYLNAQIEAGAQAVQLFDTWAGILDEAEYREWLLPVNRHIAQGVQRDRAPFILFANEAPHLTEALLESGCDVLSVGASAPMAEVAARAGASTSVQGNLDPKELTRPRDEIFARVREIAAAARAARGHILNLGHGVTPDTPVEGVRAFTDAARALG